MRYLFIMCLGMTFTFCKNQNSFEDENKLIADSIREEFFTDQSAKLINMLYLPHEYMSREKYDHYLHIYKKWKEFLNSCDSKLNTKEFEKEQLNFIFLEAKYLDKQLNIALDSFEVPENVTQYDSTRHSKAIAEIEKTFNQENDINKLRFLVKKVKEEFTIFGIKVFEKLNNEHQQFCGFNPAIIAIFPRQSKVFLNDTFKAAVAPVNIVEERYDNPRLVKFNTTDTLPVEMENNHILLKIKPENRGTNKYLFIIDLTDQNFHKTTLTKEIEFYVQ